MKIKTIKRPILTLTLSASLLILGTVATATTSGVTDKKSVFNIVSKVYADGELVSSPHIRTKENEKAKIHISDIMETKGNKTRMSGHSLKMELTANSTFDDAIKINYDVQYKNGSESVHAKPQLTVLPKQAGVVSFRSNSGHVYEIHALAERE